MQANNDRKALKSGVWYTLSNFAVKGAVFLTTPIFTRLLTKSEIGMFSNLSAWINILMIIMSLELATSITFARYEYEDSLDDFISSILVLSSTVSCFFYIIVLFFRQFFLELFSVDFYSLNLMFLYCAVCPALQMLQVKNRVLFQYKQSTALSFLSVIASTLLSLFLVLFLADKYVGRITGYYGTLIIINIAIYLHIICKGKKISTKYWRFALQISLPMVIHLFAGQLLSSCDRVMITRFCGNSENALYSIAYTCATVVSVLWNSLNTAWSPWAYEQMNNNTCERLRKYSKPYILFFAVFVVAFLLISPELMLLMGGNEYIDAIDVIPPVVVGIMYQFVYSLYVNIEFFYKKQKLTALGTLITAIVNVVLNWIFIPLFGYIAAAYTTLIGYILLFAIHFFIVKRMGKVTWYDTKFNMATVIGALLLVPGCLWLYKHNVVRYVFIILLLFMVLFILYKNRLSITNVVKSKLSKNID